MNKKDIQEKYFRGETSLEEEQWLFDQMDESEDTNEAAFASVIDELRNETFQGDIITRTISENKRSWKREIFAAAAILVFFLFYANLPNGKQATPSNKRMAKHLILNQEQDVFLAYDQSRETLLYVSARMNEVNNELEKISLFNRKIKTIKKL